MHACFRTYFHLHLHALFTMMCYGRCSAAKFCGCFSADNTLCDRVNLSDRCCTQYIRYAHGKEHLSYQKDNQHYQCYLSIRACANGVDCGAIKKEANKSAAGWRKLHRKKQKMRDTHTSTHTAKSVPTAHPAKFAERKTMFTKPVPAEQHWLKQAERIVPMSKTVTTEAAGRIAQHGSSTLQRKSDSEPITWTAMRQAAQAYTRASVRTPPGSALLLRCGMCGFWSMHQLLVLTRRQGGPGWSGPRRMPLQGVCKPIRRRGLFFHRALL